MAILSLSRMADVVLQMRNMYLVEGQLLCRVLSKRAVQIAAGVPFALTSKQFIGSALIGKPAGIQTTSTLRQGQILAMGGIIQDSKVMQTNTPFFARIPLIGWFFKGRSYEDAKTNITLFCYHQL